MDLVRRQYTSRSLQENPKIAKTLVERMSLPTVKNGGKYIKNQEIVQQWLVPIPDLLYLG